MRCQQACSLLILRLSIVTWQPCHIGQELGLIHTRDGRYFQDMRIQPGAMLTVLTQSYRTGNSWICSTFSCCSCLHTQTNMNAHSSLLLVCRAELLQGPCRRNTQASASSCSYTYASVADCACCLLCCRSVQKHHWKLSQKLLLLLMR